MSTEATWGGRYEFKGYEPFDVLRVGDVIRWNGGLRTVREIRYTPHDTVQVIGFAKLKRSGYPSPLTLYWRSEIRQSFGGIVAHRKGALCATETECALTAEIESGRSGNEHQVTERETVGRVW